MDPVNLTPTYSLKSAEAEVALPYVDPAAGQQIGGFMTSPTSLTQGSVQLNSAGETILVGQASGTLTGIGVFIGNAGDGTYDFRAGDPAGNYIQWDASAAILTIKGTVTATAGTIGGFSIGSTTLTASNLVLDSANQKISLGSGNNIIILDAGDAVYRLVVGNATYGSAPFRVGKDGAVTATNITITGGSVVTSALSGLVALANTNVAGQGWTQTSVFSVGSATQVNWGAGTFTTAAGTAYTISSGNTGTMAAKTYIYLDIAVSTTVYQTTTTAATAIGAGKVLIAVCQNNTTEAIFQVFGGNGGLNIDAANIVAGSITANEIAASTITAAKLSVTQLSAIAADLGAVTAGTLTLNASGNVKSGQTDYDTGVGFFLGINGGVAKLSVGDSSGDKITWDGTTLSITGITNTKKNYTAGEAITAGQAVSVGLYASDGGILLDSNQTASATGTTLGTGVSFTVGSHSNRIIVVFLQTGTHNNGADGATCTFDGVSATKLDSGNQQSDSGNRNSFSSWILVAPTAGAKTLAFGNLTGGDTYTYSIHSYYNVKQTGQPLAHSGQTVQRGNAGAGTNIAINVTSTSDGCLTVGMGGDQTLFNTSGSGGDTGIMIPKGLYSLTATSSNGSAISGALVCIEPFTAPTAAVVIASAKARNVTDYWATTNYKSVAFIGFANASISAGVAGAVIISGEATGLSGVSLGTQYYLSDTYGSISVTAGTNTRKAAIGTSSTTVLITNIW